MPSCSMEPARLVGRRDPSAGSRASRYPALPVHTKRDMIDPEAILVVHWWAKKTQKTAQRDIDLCARRLRQYDGR